MITIMDTDPATVLDRLLELTTLLGTDLDSGLAALGLNQARAHLLFVLAEHGPSPQRALAEALEVTPRSVTTYVDDLVAADLVSREPHPTDRRVTLVTPTPAGAELAGELVAGRVLFAGQLLGDVDAGDLVVLERCLDALCGRLRGLVAEVQR